MTYYIEDILSKMKELNTRTLLANYFAIKYLSQSKKENIDFHSIDTHSHYLVGLLNKL